MSDTGYVYDLARYYPRSPELISYPKVADWLYYLVKMVGKDRNGLLGFGANELDL